MRSAFRRRAGWSASPWRAAASAVIMRIDDDGPGIPAEGARGSSTASIRSGRKAKCSASNRARARHRQGDRRGARRHDQRRKPRLTAARSPARASLSAAGGPMTSDPKARDRRCDRRQGRADRRCRRGRQVRPGAATDRPRRDAGRRRLRRARGAGRRLCAARRQPTIAGRLEVRGVGIAVLPFTSDVAGCARRRSRLEGRAAANAARPPNRRRRGRRDRASTAFESQSRR